MRHSKIDLTMNVYTDPRLLDVSGALDALPALPLNRNPDQSTESTKATGTDGDTTKKFPPMFPPGTAQSGHSESSAVTLAFRSAEDSDYESTDSNCTNTNEKGPLSAIDNGPLLRVSNGIRTRDLRNHNPKDIGSKCLSSPEVATSAAKVSANASPKRRQEVVEPTSASETQRDFAAVVAAIMQLPLSDAEKAEAVRRLLSAASQTQ